MTVKKYSSSTLRALFAFFLLCCTRQSSLAFVPAPSQSNAQVATTSLRNTLPEMQSGIVLRSNRLNRELDENSRRRASSRGAGAVDIGAGVLLGGLLGGPFGALFGASIGANLGNKRALDKARKEGELSLLCVDGSN